MVIRFIGRTAVVLAGVAASIAIPVTTVSAQDPVIILTRPPPGLNVERVSYRDLNLATRRGQESLLRRVSRGVERVCLYDPNRGSGRVLDVQEYVDCAQGSWNRARPQMIGAIERAQTMAAYRR